MKIIYSLIFSLLLYINTVSAENFSALGEYFSVNVSKDLCILHESDPVENAMLQQAKATTPTADLPVFFVDCASLKTVKSGIEVKQMNTFGGIKNLKQKFIFSNQAFLDEIGKRFSVDSSSLDSLVEKNMKKGAKNRNIDADLSASGTKVLGKDENTLYLAGNPMINGARYQFISAFTLQKGVVFNIEIYSEEKSKDSLLEQVMNIKEQLK